MNPKINKLLFLAALFLVSACGEQAAVPQATEANQEFRVEAERFADLRILRYQVPGFAELDLQTKTLLYYLYEASLSGREIIYDQKYRYNLVIKRILEELVKHYPGDRTTADFEALLTYTKQVWFSNGIQWSFCR